MAKRKYDKVRLCYETALNQLRNQTKNKKVINLNKVTEADLKKDTFEEAFQQVSIETTTVLTSVLEQHEFLTLDALCFYLEAYYTYFSNGFEYLKELKPLIAQTKQTVQEVFPSPFSLSPLSSPFSLISLSPLPLSLLPSPFPFPSFPSLPFFLLLPLSLFPLPSLFPILPPAPSYHPPLSSLPLSILFSLSHRMGSRDTVLFCINRSYPPFPYSAIS